MLDFRLGTGCSLDAKPVVILSVLVHVEQAGSVSMSILLGMCSMTKYVVNTTSAQQRRVGDKIHNAEQLPVS